MRSESDAGVRTEHRPGLRLTARHDRALRGGRDNVEVKTLGTYLQEQLSWREKLFLTGALRADKNSAFGQDFKSVVYPAASLSWVVGEEGFFPKQDYLSSLRLRSAYGQSGQRPNFREAVRS